MFQLIPRHQIARLVEIAEAAQPRRDGDIGDGIAARDPVAPGKLAVQHGQKPRRLCDISRFRAGILDVFPGEMVEKSDLPEHRADAAHLEHQPLDGLIALCPGADQRAGLVGQIDQDRARLEQRQRRAARPVGVDDGGDLVVGVQRQECRAHLVIAGEIDQMGVVDQPHFLQRDGNLDPVGRRQRIKLNGTRRAQRPAGGDGKGGQIRHGGPRSCVERLGPCHVLTACNRAKSAGPPCIPAPTSAKIGGFCRLPGNFPL